MKKEYSAPDIFFDSFTMSTNIAAGCEIIVDTQFRGTCGYETRAGIVFVSAATGCNVVAEHNLTAGDGMAMVASNQVCYHVPASYMNLFSS